MTVCVGAIASFEGRNIIVGASDRMVTSGDIEFEQEQRKIQPLTTSVAIMVAGDLTIQADVLNRIFIRRDEHLREYSQEWLGVKVVADWFHEELASITRKRASQAILYPLGLDFERLTSPNLAPELAAQLSRELLEYQLPPIQAIVMGVDESGAHLYEVNNLGVTCQDWAGFASIGAGAWHANSQLMFGEHVKHKDMAETLMLVYTAKKRAEVAPGVGEKTDMIVIGPTLGESVSVGYQLLEELKDTYERVQQEARKVRADANARITEHIARNIEEDSTSEESPSEQSHIAGELASEHGSHDIDEA